ncbi:MAG: hypothetical protein JWM56_513 [Candidatus Peribacteria bacterium]|nr:hypothetical protein [Candidatus Peribacteria bacterium]
MSIKKMRSHHNVPTNLSVMNEEWQEWKEENNYIQPAQAHTRTRIHGVLADS